MMPVPGFRFTRNSVVKMCLKDCFPMKRIWCWELLMNFAEN
jgi:hypothetical protein